MEGKYGHFPKISFAFIAPYRKSLQNLLGKHAKMYNDKTVEAYLKGIYEYSFETGFGVSEKGWAAIDKLTDLEILKYLFALATVDNNEMTFWRWRKHIFETPETWQYFKVAKEVVAA